MKIALNIANFVPSKGGAEGYAKNLVLQLLNNGHEVHIYAGEIESENKLNYSTLYFHRVPLVKIPRALTDLSFAINSTIALKKNTFDIVIGIGGSWDVDVTCPHGGTNRGWFIQNILSVHSSAFIKTLSTLLRWVKLSNHLKFYIDRKIYRSKRLKRVIAVSQMVKKDLIHYHGLPEEMINVVYNGVDLNIFNPGNRNTFGREIRNQYGISDQSVIILFMANNFRLKGLHALIKAVPVIKAKFESDFKLLIAGRGKKRTFLKLAKKIGCDNSLIFTGQVEKAEKYYAAADIFVHPTFYDPCSLVCLEALASGLPVITTVFNGAGEILRNGVEGYVLDDPRNTTDMAEKIGLFLKKSVREQAGENARKLAEKFPWERNYTEILDAIINLPS